jgi:hypothetical protein
VRHNGSVRSLPDLGPGSREVGRRGVLLAAPAGLLTTALESVASDLLTPIGQAGADVWAGAESLVDDITDAIVSSPPSTPSREALEDAVIDAIGSRSTVVGVSVLDRHTGAKWWYRGNKLVRTGSVAKAFIVAQALRQARAKGTTLTEGQREQARLAITRSDNTAASALYEAIGRHDGVVRLATDLGLVTTATADRADHWGHTLTTPNELVTLMQAFVAGHPALHAADNAYLLDLMSGVVSGQRWGVGTVGSTAARTRLKNGWMLVDNPWVINSFGDVVGDGRDYAVAIMQRAQPDQSTGMAQASRISRAVFRTLAQPLY